MKFVTKSLLVVSLLVGSAGVASAEILPPDHSPKPIVVEVEILPPDHSPTQG